MITLKVYKTLIILTLIFISSFGLSVVNAPVSQEGFVINFSNNDDTIIDFKANGVTNGETIGIIVDPVLWAIGATVQNAINQYKKDLEDTGYVVLLHTAAIGTVQQIKTFLQNWYNVNGISGVALIGNLPYAQYYHPANPSFSAETFICDLYLMDMDGTWSDTSPVDGIYDGHSAGTGDIFPEIYVGRIDATTRTLGGLTNDANIIALLNRANFYRHAGISRTHQAITYIDDDWQ
ncbi:MAG: hypothetical protein FK733_06915, partial [Asgard group archaeon]|nr:hypothetical protein [Asgard group archaeon]